jgi:hypothetical protein
MGSSSFWGGHAYCSMKSPLIECFFAFSTQEAGTDS